jgi:hypothetical protein
MATWTSELRSSPDEGPIQGGERQARAAFRLVARTPTIPWLALIEASSAIGLWALIFVAHRGSDSFHGIGGVVESWVYGLLGFGIFTVCSVAVTCAADARIDGVEGGVRLAFAEAWQRRRVLLCWWLISIAVTAGLGFAIRAATHSVLALVGVATLWGIVSVFVVPAIAIEGGGVLDSFRAALRFTRACWRRALPGLVVILLTFGVAEIAWLFVMNGIGFDRHPHARYEPLWRFGLPFLVLYVIYTLMSATRGTFTVILARDALDDLPGAPPAVKPRRPTVRKLRRIAFVVLGLVVLLIVVVAIVGPRRTHPESGPAAARSSESARP